MKANRFIIALIASSVLATPVLAQEAAKTTTDDAAVETSTTSEHRGRGPIDLATFTNIEELKAADTNKDGILSREEIEAYALKKIVQRAADRIERRLDVNHDGKISLEAIEKQRTEKFNELDTNKDGKLDRAELKAGKHHGKHHGKHDGKHHGKRHHGDHKKDSDQKKSDDKSND